MQITRETDYAIRCVLHLARQPRGLAPAAEIAPRRRRSRGSSSPRSCSGSRRAGIVVSQRGVQGGFPLARDPGGDHAARRRGGRAGAGRAEPLRRHGRALRARTHLPRAPGLGAPQRPPGARPGAAHVHATGTTGEEGGEHAKGGADMSEYAYDEKTVKGFIVSSIFWGVVGILIGLWISIQMWMPSWNIAPYFTFGRLRVVHTNGLAFGLGIGAIFGIFYYIVMRLTKRPLLLPEARAVPSVSVQRRDRAGGAQPLRGHEPVPGVRRARVAARHRRRRSSG